MTDGTCTAWTAQKIYSPVVCSEWWLTAGLSASSCHDTQTPCRYNVITYVNNDRSLDSVRIDYIPDTHAMLTLSPPSPLRHYTFPYWSNPPFLIFDIRGALALRTERQSAQMSKIKNGGLDPVWC